ncbi:MAG: tetratricopeptide repeat protein [Candidatus Kapaibacteriota bacterium]
MSSMNRTKLQMDLIVAICTIITIASVFNSCGSMQNVRNGSYNLARYSTLSKSTPKNLQSIPETQQKYNVETIQTRSNQNEIPNKVVAGETSPSQPQIQSNCNEQDIEFFKLKMAKLEEEIVILRNEISQLVSLLNQKSFENESKYNQELKPTKKVVQNINKTKQRVTSSKLNHIAKSTESEQKAEKAKKDVNERVAKASYEQNKRIEEIVKLIKERKYDAALKEIDDSFQEESDLGTIGILSYWKGEALYYKGDFAKALESFQKAVSIPNSRKRTEAQIMTAECYTKLGKLKEAKREYQKFIEEYPFSEYTPRAKRMVQQL